jgi:hypothetical protein
MAKNKKLFEIGKKMSSTGGQLFADAYSNEKIWFINISIEAYNV